MNQRTKNPGTLYEMPSGMGGSFTVRITENRADNRVQVQIWMPGNPDFHGHYLETSQDNLTQVAPRSA